MTQLLTPPPKARPPAAPPRDSDADELEDDLDFVAQRLNDDNGLEYVDGEFREKTVSERSSFIGTEVATELNLAARAGDGGRVARVYGSDLAYRLWPDQPLKSRRPDVSVIRTGRLRELEADPGTMPIVPDLAVEVISPGDRIGDFMDKLGDYQAAGVPLTWVIFPSVGLVQAHTADAIRQFRGDDELTLPDLLPAFRLTVATLLAPATPAAAE